MADSSASWEEIGEFIQDAARQMREYGLTTLDIEHNGSRVRLKIKEPRLHQSDAIAPAEVVRIPVAQPQSAEPTGHVLTSPMIGTFYASSSPDDAPFVQEGDLVEAGQVIGIIEAMKIMNEITSEHDGVIERILVKNAQAVEYGQPLFSIGPDS